MNKILLPVLIALAGCGRGELTDEPGPVEQQQSLVGTYEFGPMVEQGFAGTPHRLATLHVEADGTFKMSYMIGCLGSGAEGTWASMAQGLQLSVQHHRFSSWTGEDGEALRVTTLRAAAASGGIVVSGNTDDGSALTQRWSRTSPEMP